jgi:hypothetical protein
LGHVRGPGKIIVGKLLLQSLKLFSDPQKIPKGFDYSNCRIRKHQNALKTPLWKFGFEVAVFSNFFRFQNVALKIERFGTRFRNG